MSRRTWAAVARALFVVCLSCLMAAVLLVDGWMVSQRLLAVAGIAALGAVVAMIGAVP